MLYLFKLWLIYNHNYIKYKIMSFSTIYTTTPHDKLKRFQKQTMKYHTEFFPSFSKTTKQKHILWSKLWFQQQVLCRWHYREAWESSRQHFRGFYCKYFRVDSRYSNVNKLQPLLVDIFRGIYTVFVLNG